ncbi:MAG: MarR family winged helix-turn-helix transcriptional regulator [Pseudomonadota bacterium]
MMPNDMNQHPTARLMLFAFRKFEERLLDELGKVGFPDVTLSDLNVLRHLDPEGLRVTILAEHAGLTKQAVGQIAKGLEKKGYVRITADAEDGRAKSIVYTKRGKVLIEQAIHVVRNIERHYEAALGKRGYQALRASLLTLLASGDAL